MKYLTSMQASNLMGVTKRHINNMCATHEMPGAYKDGYRWMIPEKSVLEKMGSKTGSKVGSTRGTRSFNTTGICSPEKHYMVNLEQRLAEVKILVDDGKYFTINRARQFGKTTTLQALGDYLNTDYFVVSMDFQMQMSNAKFKSENSFSLAFAKAFTNSFYANPESGKPGKKEVIKKFSDCYQTNPESFELVELFQALSMLCMEMNKQVVLMIDEVDSAANNQVFLDFLAQLRGYYINRRRFATFQSVILAGVCDIKNLKRKMRPEDEHKDNSPWNIAADFDIDMSFSPIQIKTMLDDYEDDYGTGMSTEMIAQEIYDYTEGYPYLVSRLCQILEKQYDKNRFANPIIDLRRNTAPFIESCAAASDKLYYNESRKNTWTHEGMQDAVRSLLSETNSLFDDMAKKIKDYPELRNMLYDILFCGRSIPYNPGTELVSMGTMFGFLKNNAGQIAISNRIFEIWFYNLFIAEEAIESKTYDAGQNGKNQFIKEDGLDIVLILKKFVQHFTEVYGNSPDSFVEENGRKLFLLYIRPLINGIGNYYIESRTRSMGRTDLIIDYLGKQYIIEMKICAPGALSIKAYEDGKCTGQVRIPPLASGED